jgi:hypothetical protein
MLVSADIIRGRAVTSYFSIKDDLVNAGGNWVDKEVVVDGHLVTSRTPGRPARVYAGNHRCPGDLSFETGGRKPENNSRRANARKAETLAYHASFRAIPPP